VDFELTLVWDQLSRFKIDVISQSAQNQTVLRKNMKAILCLLLIGMLIACGATGPKFHALKLTENSVAVVYVYRAHYFPNRNQYPHLQIDGVGKGPLRDSGYIVSTVEPNPPNLSPSPLVNR
jgi:hypothetical protein